MRDCMRMGMKHTAVLLLACASQAANAATLEDGLRLKQEQKLEEAATVFAEVAEAGDPAGLEQLAIVLSWLKHYDESIVTWRRALAMAPERKDFHVGLARVLYWKGEHDLALTELDQALAAQPDNVEALTLKGDVLMAQNQAAAAREIYAQAKARGGESANLAELDAKLARAVVPTVWRLDAGGGYDHYSNAREHEYSAYTQLGYSFSRALSVYAHYDHFDNFGATDEILLAGGYVLIQDLVLLNVEAGGAVDDADFRADSQAAIYADLLLDGFVQPLLGVRYLDYDNGEVTTIIPGLRFLADAAELELRYGITDNVDGRNTEVFSARASYHGDGYSPYIAIAAGEEALPPQALADIRIFAAGCVFDLSPTWGLRADYSFEDRKRVYEHDTFALGLTYRY